MEDKKGQLEVEIIRARSLTQKPGSKSTPGKERCLDKKILHRQGLKTFADWNFICSVLCHLIDLKGSFSVLFDFIKIDPHTIILSESVRKSTDILRKFTYDCFLACVNCLFSSVHLQMQKKKV